ncbi:NAD(P)H-hydrate dehydratase [Gaiella sp.]|uniref:NAD(P)H-hydrate dehydratase n=1 Tax=Gaiella sp. TaxID=2663207 RepID=UPI0032665AE9
MAEPGFEWLYTAAEMRAAEEAYPGFPGTAPELMERAGAAVAYEARRAFPEARRFAVVCGGGSNGGDGRIAARRLREAGLEAVETDAVEGCDVVIDALFGTGFEGPPRPEAAQLIERINACGRPVVSVDVPSGVDASTGEVAGSAVNATLTVTFHASKVGLHVTPGRFHRGELAVADIGLAPAVTAARRATRELLDRVPRRGLRDSKFTAGAVLVVGGAPGTTGAPVLAAMAALRADAGYVAIAVPRECFAVVETLALEPVKRGFDWADAEETILAEAERADAVALGPGLGRSREAQALVARLLERLDLPVVVDADALFGLRPTTRANPTVLTPHAGELARLLDRDSDWIAAHRLEAARTAAEMFGAVVLLKGADTIVHAPTGELVVCDAGPASLATAGTGDVLTGIVAAFLAKGLDSTTAAAAAATAHGLAAAAVPYQAGLVAGDVFGTLPAILSTRGGAAYDR